MRPPKFRNKRRVVAAAGAVLFGASLLTQLHTSAYADVPAPVGPSGAWSNVFDDEFNANSVDTSKWSAMNGGHMNNVTTSAANVTETGGDLVLTLASSSSGAYVSTEHPDNGGAGYGLPVGGYAEARVEFPGNGTSIYNWPAWWVSGPGWPAAGENDIAEGLGTLTTNYHSSSGAHNQGTTPGVWSNAFHTYGVYRGANRSDVYWDGVLVHSYATDDNHLSQSLLINVGDSNTHVYGAGSQVKVDWVRAWAPGTAKAPVPTSSTTTKPQPVISSTTSTTTKPVGATTTTTVVKPVTTPSTPAPVAAGNPVAVPFRMDAGSTSAHTDALGQSWQADQYAYGASSQFTGDGGQNHAVTNAIAGTNDQTLFQSERWGMNGYKIPIANGTYKVVMGFAEISPTVANNQRTQTITANGQVVVDAMNAQKDVGAFTSDTKTVTVTVTNGVLNLAFSSANEPSLSGLEILAAGSTGAGSAGAGSAGAGSTGAGGSAGVIRINAGGGSYTDNVGNVWSADKDYVGGYTYSVTNPIKGTAKTPLYQSERWGMSAYKIPVSNGKHVVTLRMAEISPASGPRVMSVTAEGQSVIQDLNIASKVGDYVAYNQQFTVNVTDGELDLGFSATINSPKVSAIAVD